jgi:integrase
VRWRTPDGHRQSKAFKTAEQRADFVRDLHALRSTRPGVRVLDPDSAARLDEFRKLTEGADLLEVGRFWAEHHRPLPIVEAVRRYEAAQAGRKLSGDTLSHRRLHLARLVSALGEDTKLGEITAARLREWLDRLTLDGAPASAASKRHHRANAARLWSWLRAEGLAKGDPFAAVPMPDQIDDEITILSVAEGRHLFAVNRDHPSVARLACEAFAGLRFSSAARLEFADINWDLRGITLPGAKHKSRRRHYIDNLPANLWSWLDRARSPEAWTLPPRAYLTHKGEMFRAAGFVGERFRNVLRHSAATYHSAAYQDPGRTATMLTHRGQDQLWASYRGRSTQVDGLAWFSIVP